MDTSVNILSDDLKPTTFGQYIDSLIIANIRMWHAQETVYETETLNAMSRDQMFDFLKKATWLNLERNTAMDGLDKELAGMILQQNPTVNTKKTSADFDPHQQLWES